MTPFLSSACSLVQIPPRTFEDKREEQAGAELGQAQVKIDDIFEVVVDVVVKAVVKIEVELLVRVGGWVGGWSDKTKLILIST